MRNFVSIHYECKPTETPYLWAFSVLFVIKITFQMAVLGVFLVLIGLTLWVRRLIDAEKERKRVKSEGEKMANPYVIEHEKKVLDDSVYSEYIEWCKFHGELPMEKKGFDEIRMKEWELRQKIKKAIR